MMERVERYVVFVRNMQTGEEFVCTQQAPEGSHETLVALMRRKFPRPDFEVHTAYTVKELTEVICNVERWCGEPRQNPRAGRGSYRFIPPMRAVN